MGINAIITLVVLLAMLVALIADKLRPGLVLGSAVVALLVCGIISGDEAVSGFCNKGMITVALLYLVSEGVRKSGLLERVIYGLLPKDGKHIRRSNMRFLPVVAAVSAFLNNTPVVVIFGPMIKNWATKVGLPPAKFLIPLSYATVLGGVCTLIGTSTNIVVDGMIRDMDPGAQGLGMFTLARVGLFICLVGLFYLVMIAPSLLPEGRGTAQPDKTKMEVMLSTRFPGLGRTLREFDFYRHYGVNVRAIRRKGEMMDGDYFNTRLTKDDTLIVDGDESFRRAWKDSRVFLMINRIGEIEAPLGTRKKWLSLVLVVLMITGATVWDDMFVCAAVTTVIMAWCGLFSPARYTKFISWDVLITIACAFGISKGMINSGLADVIANQIIHLAEAARHSERGIYIMLAALYLITNVFTELITNNAAAALGFPLAVSIANTLGVDPTPFFVCVCFAASASFSSPIGYQTNMIVQGMGGYKFMDFVRVGLPLNLIVFLLSVFLIPVFYG